MLLSVLKTPENPPSLTGLEVALHISLDSENPSSCYKVLPLVSWKGSYVNQLIDFIVNPGCDLFLLGL